MLLTSDAAEEAKLSEKLFLRLSLTLMLKLPQGHLLA